jgi:Fe2+ or Zn2+ uptake regulation protein
VTLDAIEERLRGAGLRVTAPRVAVLRVLEEATDHPRVDQVIERVRAAGVAISTQAAYDVCEALHRAALARRIDLAGGPARFEARGAAHHHVVCRVCGATVDVACASPAAPAEAHGFAIDDVELTFWGTCPACTPANERTPA